MRQRLALVFLVLLRMAIGWHFLFEALEKYHTRVELGPTDRSRPWTSEGYFREAPGPLAVLMRMKIGDLDDMALAKLTVRDVPPGEDIAKYPLAKRMPDGLDRDWSDYFARFTAHYGLDSNKREALNRKLEEEREKTVASLLKDEKTFKRNYPSGTLELKMTVQKRAEEYRAKVRQYRELKGPKLLAMGTDVEKSRRPALGSEVAALRSELLNELNAKTADMKKVLEEGLSADQKAKGPVPESKDLTFIKAVDEATMYGLMAIGAGLLLGFFSRLSAFGGAIFLLLTVLTVPSLPWIPVPPNTEGNYFIVSKNVIEMLALFMLACIPSGRWFGIDALLHALNPWAKRDEALL